MKRIILGINVLLMLVQNGFAVSDSEYDNFIMNSTGYMKQTLKCEKVANHHLKDGNVLECVKAVKMLEDLPNSNLFKKTHLNETSYNTGQIYFFGLDNKIKSYEYWFKASKFGHQDAQKNLDLLCRKYPWACK